MFIFKIIRRALSLILLVAIVVPLYCGYQIWETGKSAKPAKSDIVVILGAAQFNGVPSDILQARIDEADKVYRNHLANHIVTVGAGATGDNFTESSSSTKSLRALGVPQSAVTSIPIGRDTLASTLAYVAYMKLHGYTSAIIATDPYHCYRAMAMARDLGVTASCAPSESGPAKLSTSKWRYIVRETGAYLAYKTVGRLGIHLSDQIKK